MLRSPAKPAKPAKPDADGVDDVKTNGTIDRALHHQRPCVPPKTRPFLRKFHEVLDASPLSTASKNAYKSRLCTMVSAFDHDVDWIIDHCRDVRTVLESKYAPETRVSKSYVNAVLMLFKHTQDLKLKRPRAYKRWFKYFMRVKAITEAKYDNVQASDRQREAYVEWDEVLRRRDALPRDSDAYLLLWQRDP